jgi:CheY-like chemotaxis protein
MDGYELATRLRERFRAEACQLIALSGYGQANDKERSARAGFAVHLVKPVDFEKLLSALQSDPKKGNISRDGKAGIGV